MKRFSAIGAGLLLLTACSQAALPKEEVFGRAQAAIRGFTSATFSVQARSETGGRKEWEINANGQMASGGKQLRFDVTASMGRDAFFKGSVTVPAENEVYVKADSLSLGESLLPGLGSLQGTWWKLPSTASGVETTLPVTPDPSLLTMQMEIVQVTREYGIERINQRQAYRYDVAVDRQKMVNYMQTLEQGRGGEFDREEWNAYLDAREITGTVWIDAETFLPNRLEWTVAERGGSTMTLEAAFADHNAGVSVLPPASFSPFPATADALQGLIPQVAPVLP